MIGWGKFPGFIALGLVLSAACGGRTDALEGDYSGSAADGAGADAGTPAAGGSSAGRPGHGGTTGTAGSRPTAGTHQGGSPAGGAYTTGGVSPAGGAYTGGTFGTGGTFPVAGTFTGGTSFGGFATGGSGPFGDCQSCLKSACSGQLVQCLSDFGCISIFSCMQQSRCLGFECYSPDTCQKVIDQYGGPNGASMNELLQIVACGFTAGCQCG
jgi:hypothetical protein